MNQSIIPKPKTMTKPIITKIKVGFVKNPMIPPANFEIPSTSDIPILNG